MFGDFLYAEALFALSGAIREWQEQCLAVSSWVSVSPTASTANTLSPTVTSWTQISKNELPIKRC